jgi:quercetin dioxygenase-like cupin family protein
MRCCAGEDASGGWSLIYWLLDSGGPVARYIGERPYPDFAFSQQLSPELAQPDWRAKYVDYLILGLTTSTAFSPTDVMPMAAWAKLTMALQSIVSLIVVGLVIARAVNVCSHRPARGSVLRQRRVANNPPAAAGDRERGLRRDRRLGHRASDHPRARPPRAGGEGEGPAHGRQVGDLRRGDLGEHRRPRRIPLPFSGRLSDSHFGTWNDVPLFEFRDGVNIHAVGGDQVLVCRVNYDPGFGVGTHAHEHTEQVMIVSNGELELTVEGETRVLRPGDWAVIGRGIEHSVRTEGGAQFWEALSPVPLDHVPDRDRDLVLGVDGGAGNVER